MNLLIVRHGIAIDPDEWKEKGKEDKNRPLTKKGESKFKSACKGLKFLCPEVSKIYTSDFKRAVQTAELLQKFYPNTKIKKSSKLHSDTKIVESWEMVSEWVDNAKDSTVAMIGHNPHLEEFIEYLLGGGTHGGVTVELKKGGASLFHFGDPRNVLNWHMTQKELIYVGMNY